MKKINNLLQNERVQEIGLLALGFALVAALTMLA
jgi:hypothetical protein